MSCFGTPRRTQQRRARWREGTNRADHHRHGPQLCNGDARKRPKDRQVRQPLSLEVSYPAFVKTAALIVHGGAWDVPDELYESCRLGAGRAVERGWKILA